MDLQPKLNTTVYTGQVAFFVRAHEGGVALCGLFLPDCYFSLLFIQLCLFTVLETDDVGICFFSGYILVGLVDFFCGGGGGGDTPQAVRLIPSSTHWHTEKGYANVWGMAAVSANRESFTPPTEEPICPSLVWNTKIAPPTTGMNRTFAFRFSFYPKIQEYLIGPVQGVVMAALNFYFSF